MVGREERRGIGMESRISGILKQGTSVVLVGEIEDENCS
jgi:hypothetical protein